MFLLYLIWFNFLLPVGLANHEGVYVSSICKSSLSDIIDNGIAMIG